MGIRVQIRVPSVYKNRMKNSIIRLYLLIEGIGSNMIFNIYNILIFIQLITSFILLEHNTIDYK